MSYEPTDFGGDAHGKDGPIIARRFKEDEWLPDQRAFYDACLAIGHPDCPDHNDPDATGVRPGIAPQPWQLGGDGIRFSHVGPSASHAVIVPVAGPYSLHSE